MIYYVQTIARRSLEPLRELLFGLHVDVWFSLTIFVLNRRKQLQNKKQIDHYDRDDFNSFILTLLMTRPCASHYNSITSKTRMSKHLPFIVKGRLLRSDKFHLRLEDS